MATTLETFRYAQSPAEAARERIASDLERALQAVAPLEFQCRLCGELHEPPSPGCQRWCYGTARRPHLPMHVPGRRP